MDPDAPIVKGYQGKGIPSNRDALNYLAKIKEEFRDQPEVNEEFISLMDQFKKNEISNTAVVQSVGELFKGHPALIEGFNVFLPPGVSVDADGNAVGRVLTPPAQVWADKLDEIYTIIRFSDRVKARDLDLYDRFINILSTHYHRRHDVEPDGVKRQISNLLLNDDDLYSQFQRMVENRKH